MLRLHHFKNYCALFSSIGVLTLSAGSVRIESEDDYVREVVSNPDGDYVLTSDLAFTNLAAIPAFSGTLDGNGYKITGLSSNLVNVLTGTIKNLTIRGLNFQHTRIKSNICEPMAAFVARLQGGAVRDCTLEDSSLTMPNGYAANLADVGFAGIVANVESGVGEVSGCRIVGCTIGCRAGSGQLQPFGGIVGRVATTDQVTISGCKVLGSETRDSTISGCRVGGILGNAVANCHVRIEGCYNEGVISNALIAAGGMMANGDDSNSNSATIDICNCTNVANITVGCGGVGGILGYCYKGGMVRISGCVNRGNISSAHSNSSFGATSGTGTAGILGGFYSYLATGGVKIDSSANFGTIFAATNSAGGIVGRYNNANYATSFCISNSANHASVSSASYAGGLVGAITATQNCVSGDILVNCCQTGDVSAQGDDSAGGLIGFLYGTGNVTDYIRCVWQSGVVSSARASASPMIGSIGLSATKGFKLNIIAAHIGGSANCSDGSVGLLTGATQMTSSGSFVVNVDETSRFANSASVVSYYDSSNGAAELSLNTLAESAGVDGTAQKALNAFALENGLVEWVQTSSYPDLSLLASAPRRKGLLIIIR